jgi:DNA (cytosine-5)-methyltransferase 1
MGAPLVLSLFPGIGLLDLAFEEAGFCVVRGPDLLWGGDVRKFHPPAGRFDGVIGGPPCQAFSRLRHLVEANGYKTAPNLIPEFERVVLEAAPAWWVMENVPDAPVPAGAACSALTTDVDCGGLTSRLRRWSWAGFHLDLPPVSGARAAFLAVTCDARDVPVAIGGSGKPKRRNQGNGGTAPHEGPQLPAGEMLRRQGFAPDLLDGAPFTNTALRKAVGNGVPLPMGRAVARAVAKAIGFTVADTKGAA